MGLRRGRKLLLKEEKRNLQSKNKKARILTQSTTVQKYVLFPEGWGDKWPGFYRAVADYQKEGKNEHDDAPDTLTGLVEKTGNKDMSVGSVPISL